MDRPAWPLLADSYKTLSCMHCVAKFTSSNFHLPLNLKPNWIPIRTTRHINQKEFLCLNSLVDSLPEESIWPACQSFLGLRSMVSVRIVSIYFHLFPTIYFDTLMSLLPQESCETPIIGVLWVLAFESLLVLFGRRDGSTFSMIKLPL